jgi:hypothetical protein
MLLEGRLSYPVCRDQPLDYVVLPPECEVWGCTSRVLMLDEDVKKCQLLLWVHHIWGVKIVSLNTKPAFYPHIMGLSS